MLTPKTYTSHADQDIMSRHLCGFCDASTRAYAAVVYLVSVTKWSAKVSFVAAKTRVSPLQPLTIPRLELLLALLLTRLVTTVIDSLRFVLQEVSVRCFTDSRVALYWIQGMDKVWKPFIRNRVAEIRQGLTPECWNHCSGSTNHVDLPSRGMSLNELSVSKLWQHGLDWLPLEVLLEGKLEAPVLRMPDECIPELKIASQPTCAMLMTAQQPTIG